MPDRPNILIFLPDGMQAQVTRPDHACRTPNFDRLADRGVRFSRAHTVLPTCSPARASLMTGLLPHNHGVLQVEHCVDDDQCILRTQYPHWAQHLTEAGYRTGYFGKWHIERTNKVEDFGWQINGCDESAAFRAIGAGVAGTDQLVDENSLTSYETGPEGYNDVLHYGVTDVPSEERSFAATTRLAQEYLSDCLSHDDPWACFVSFPEPNVPVITGKETYESYDIDAIDLPGNFGDDFAGSPAFYRRQKEIWQDIPERNWREARAVYYSLVTELDAQFGKLLDQLENAGQLDNTIVIVMADHGRYMGAHGLDAHNYGAFEEAYNIPLIVAGPGVATGVETAALVSIVDLCPTLLELTGARPIGVPDSRSFAPLLADPVSQASNYDRCYAEFFGTRFLTTQRILWQGDWKLVFNGFDYDELYNLKDDPHELNNLAADPEHRDRMVAMMSEIWKIVHETDDQALLGTHYAPMRIAVVGPNTGKP
ncbi:MAG: sulfatase-like hydrolase/transferase [Candidatus Latescibacteria bacterium]|jgi:arylsulfatase A-like enzyme|nr:sulfatase-like hydrolase/transferase [Candidatus Latescibacterota bacterium]